MWNPPTPRNMKLLGGQGGIFKSCLRVAKLWIWFLRGSRRCLKVTLRKCAPTCFRSCGNLILVCLIWFVYLMATYGCVFKVFKQKFNQNYLCIATDTIGVFSEPSVVTQLQTSYFIFILVSPFISYVFYKWIVRIINILQHQHIILWFCYFEVTKGIRFHIDFWLANLHPRSNCPVFHAGGLLFTACVCKVPIKYLRSHLQSFGTLGQLSK